MEKQTFKSIKTEFVVVSKEGNVRTVYDKATLDDLTASIKERGVLVPIIVRKDGDRYQLVAGHRRLRAAIAAGLDDVPAQVMDLTDEEAKEVQIIENLQRADVHPLDEGAAYRALNEAGKREISDIAAKVGKSEAYVRGRLVLTNLGDRQVKEYRAGKILDGHAALLARLAPADQDAALKALLNDWGGPMSVSDLKEWIESHVNSSLDHQPWRKSKEGREAVGECVECPPNMATLFGDGKEGACTSLACWKRKMEAWIEHVAKAENATKVSGEYGRAPAGMAAREAYVLIGKGESRSCASATTVVFATGPRQGKTAKACLDASCKTHRAEASPFRRSPAEKAKLKKQRAAEKRKQLRDDAATDARLRKVKWPMTEKALDALFELALLAGGYSGIGRVVRRRKLAVKKDGSAEKAIRAFVKSGGKSEKLQICFDLLLPNYNEDQSAKFIGKI